MTIDGARVAKEKMHGGMFAACGRFLVPILIFSLIPAAGCGRYRARKELKRGEYFAEILKRVDRRWIGDDGFFEDNILANPDPQVRQWCAAALGRIASPRALPLLYRALHRGDAAVRAASAFALGEIEDRELLGERDPRTVAELVLLLDDPSLFVRMRAIEALGKAGSHEEAETIVRRLDRFSYSGSPVERAYVGFAVTALARLGNPAAIPVLERLVGGRDPEIRWRALDALTRLQDKAAGPLYIENLKDPNPDVARYAARGLGNLESGAAGLLVPFLPPRDRSTGKPIPLSVRASAIEALGNMKSASAVPSVKAALEAEPVDEAHPDQQNFAVLAAAALGAIGSQEGESALLPLLRSVQPVADSALIGLAKILKGNPERFFELAGKTRLDRRAASPAWARAMGELGGPDAAEELKRMLMQAIETQDNDPALLPAILASLRKVNPPGLEEIVSPFFGSRNPVLLRAALSAYQPGPETKDPWIPIVRAFTNCPEYGHPETKIEILFRLAPWTANERVRQALWTGLKDPERIVRLASLALLRKSGLPGVAREAGPSTASVTDTTCRALAASRKNTTIAVVETTRGTMEIELFREEAPLTVHSFVLTAKNRGFGGFVFDVIPSQRIGGKDLGSQAGFGRTINGEINMRPFERGSVGLAHAARKDSRRFFISLAPEPYLDGVDTCFGRVISGMQVADRIVPGDRILDVRIKETISFLDYVQY